MTIAEYEPLDYSENHVTQYKLVKKTNAYEVIIMNIKKDALLIVQEEECEGSLNTYEIQEGALYFIDHKKTYNAGTVLSYKDISKPFIFQALDNTQLMWVIHKPIYDSLVQENDVIMTTLQKIKDKDHYTREHSLRVAVLAKQLAIKANCSGREVSNLAIAALSHDLGKVNVADNILNKPHRLTDEEFDIIREHVIDGYDLVKDLFSTDVTNIILQHHERLDGSGYPNNLSGEEICYGAKILAIVDSYDAMKTERPYKKALPNNIIIDEFIKCKDTMYDSELIDLFIEIIKINA